MTDISAKDCRIEGFRSGGTSRWYKATHLPTGTVVEFGNGLTSKREAMKALQSAVNDMEQVKAARMAPSFPVLSERDIAWLCGGKARS